MSFLYKHILISIAICLLMISLSVACSPTTSFIQPTALKSGQPAKILFASQGYIYTIGLDGSRQERLTDSGNDNDPAWSKNDQQIFFVCSKDICTMDQDGNHISHLVHGNNIETPAFFAQ